MQDRVSRSTSELSRSPAPTDPNFFQPIRKPKSSWMLQAVWIGMCSFLFGTLIFSSELIVTSFRARAAEPLNIAQDSVLLDFTAKWCGPCQSMSPIVSRLERAGFPIRKVDIDQESRLAKQFNIESIPCFVLVANGREVNRITGATDERELRRLLALLPRQNIDDSIAKNAKSSSSQNSVANNSSSKSGDEKKSLLRIPPLFNRNQDKDKDQDLAMASAPDTFRGQNPLQETGNESYSKDPLAVSTRIRVKDGSRNHYGSGTIIESMPGRSILLTCGHIFRDLGNDAVIEVDVFAAGSSKPQTVIGQIIRFDLKSDLGLVALPTKGQLPVIRLSSLQSPPMVKDRVVSIGCGGGERPSREDHQITAINKYLGPDNIECDGVPQQGRSGGGLFLKSELIGICIAADPKEKRGIYTSMKPVVQLLQKSQLGHLIPSNAAQPSEGGLADHGNEPREATLGSAVAFNEEAPPPRNKVDDDLAGILATAAVARDNGDQPIAMGDYVGAEIVCIVRPKTPGAPTRVVIVNQASSRFVGDLLHEPVAMNRNEANAAKLTAGKKSPGKTPGAKVIETANRKSKPVRSFDDADLDELDGPIETSYESRNRRFRD